MLTVKAGFLQVALGISGKIARASMTESLRVSVVRGSLDSSGEQAAVHRTLASRQLSILLFVLQGSQTRRGRVRCQAP